MSDRIERELELDLTVGALWRAVTDPTRLVEWLADEVELELWPGGEAHFLVDGDARTGWVEEVSPPGEAEPGRLVFWWQVDGEPASRVALEVGASERGARLRVVEVRPLEVLDLVGIPFGGVGGQRFGPALVAA